MNVFLNVFLSAFVAWEIFAVVTLIATRFIPSLPMLGGKALKKAWVSHTIALVVWIALLVLSFVDPFGLSNLVSRVDSGLFEFVAWSLLAASVVAVLIASYRGATGDKAAGIFFLAVLLLLLGGFLHWNPFNWETPRIQPSYAQTTSPNSAQPQIGADLEIANPNDIQQLKNKISQLGAKGSIVKQLFDKAAEDGTVTNGELAIIMAQISKELDSVRQDSSAAMLDIVQQHEKDSLTAQTRLKMLEGPAQKSAQDANAALLKELQALRDRLNPPASNGGPIVDNPNPSNGPAVDKSAKKTSQGWKSWKNLAGITVSFDRFGEFWPAGASYTPARQAVAPGAGIEGTPLEAGDYGVIMDSEGNYYDISGQMEHNGVSRDGWAVDPSGNLRQVKFIRYGEDVRVDLEKRPLPQFEKKPARYAVPVDNPSEIFRVRNTGE